MMQPEKIMKVKWEKIYHRLIKESKHENICSQIREKARIKENTKPKFSKSVPIAHST